MSVIEMSRAIVRKNVVIEGESAAHERYVRARVVRKQKRPSTLIATITIRGVRVQTLIARFFSTTAKTLTTKGEEVIQSRERERKNSITNNKRERERERRRQNALERLSLFFLRTDTTALTDFFGAVVLETTRTPVNWVVVSANIFYSRRRVMIDDDDNEAMIFALSFLVARDDDDPKQPRKEDQKNLLLLLLVPTKIPLLFCCFFLLVK